METVVAAIVRASDVSSRCWELVAESAAQLGAVQESLGNGVGPRQKLQPSSTRRSSSSGCTGACSWGKYRGWEWLLQMGLQGFGKVLWGASPHPGFKL